MLAAPAYVERAETPIVAATQQHRCRDQRPTRGLKFELLRVFDTPRWSAGPAWRAMAGMSKVQAARRLEVVPSAPEAAAAPAARPEAMLVDVVVLTGDLELFGAAREAVGERNPVWRARSAEEAAELLITGRCGVLLIDMASVSSRADSLIEQIVDQFPDVVVCVAGNRSDEPQLASLISDGLVYRFMHKPATAKRAGMFLQAAIRRHAERRDGGAGRDPLLPILRGLTRPRTGIPRRYVAWLLAACLAVTVPLFIDMAPEPAVPDAGRATPAPAVAIPGPSVADGVERADPVLSRARAALQAGRLDQPEGRNALDLFQAVLLAQPDNAEARAGLARTIALLMTQATQDAAAGRKRDAARITRRVLAIEPTHPVAQALDRQVNPPDTPSRQLQREQVAEARAPVVVPAPGGTAPAAPAVTPAPAARAVDTPAATPPRVAAARDTQPRPDPLAPRYTNPPPRPAVAGATSPRRYGAPINNTLPTAGLAVPRPPAPSTQTEPAVAPGIVAADEFDRVVARDPVYPAAALRNKTRGWVELEFTVMPNGAVRDVAVVGAEPNGVFEAAASAALADWRFRPRVVNGQPVAQRSRITMRFDVDD